MIRGSTVHREGWLGASDELGVYSCPVCGIELMGPNIETAPRPYYCPSCCTQLPPSMESLSLNSIDGSGGWNLT